ncbi:NapC/NirT family cytochrome c [Hoeflea olei]|uniref:Cytochrome c-type protein n=1 Tax=Hoeflea olei TaxID=1480615 RepID=A0A1C1YSN1_9HYPH|nr:NapC/NirT family cytochrome c [Hoeflea olei]OCW56367.1 hypothetical protein AWJ14_19975 [Hoeflea olei]
MTNPLKAAFRFLTRPATIGIVGGAGVLVGVFGFVGFHTALEKTTTTEFCVSCHSMADNNFEEYKQTVHYKNPSGVRAGCPDCHVPKGGLELYQAKLLAAKDVWSEIAGTIDTREKFNSERLRMAKTVWATMKANDSAQCRSCHSYDAMDFEHQRPKAVKMRQAAKDGGTCIDCHKGIAHELPDMSSGYKSIYASLTSGAKDNQSAKVLYALASANLYAEKPADDAAKGDGNIMPLTQVTVLEKDGDWIKVGIDGWMQEGMERALVKEMGRRLFLAVMSADMVKGIEVQETQKDADTGLNWTEGRLTAWAKIDTFTSDRNGITSYGDEMYIAACGTCHSAPLPGHFLANQWAGVMKDMKTNTTLSAEEYRFLLSYLQLNAKDMPKDSPDA